MLESKKCRIFLKILENVRKFLKRFKSVSSCQSCKPFLKSLFEMEFCAEPQIYHGTNLLRPKIFLELTFRKKSI